MKHLGLTALTFLFFLPSLFFLSFPFPFLPSLLPSLCVRYGQGDGGGIGPYLRVIQDLFLSGIIPGGAWETIRSDDRPLGNETGQSHASPADYTVSPAPRPSFLAYCLLLLQQALQSLKSPTSYFFSSSNTTILIQSSTNFCSDYKNKLASFHTSSSLPIGFNLNDVIFILLRSI